MRNTDTRRYLLHDIVWTGRDIVWAAGDIVWDPGDTVWDPGDIVRVVRAFVIRC